jgi:uncharacterized membrane protein YdjX (TVP38/TMEM64 family)
MRLVLPFLALALLVLVPWMIWGESWDEQFTLDGSVRWLEGAGSWAWAAGLGLLVVDLALPVPGTVVMSALGFIYGPLAGGLIAALGATLAGLAGYGIGRFCPESFARRWMGEKDYEKGSRLFARSGGWVVAASRALPVLSEVLSCTAGLMRMPFSNFLAALASGAIPVGFIFAAIGAAGREEPLWAAALAILLPLVLWFAASRTIHH